MAMARRSSRPVPPIRAGRSPIRPGPACAGTNAAEPRHVATTRRQCPLTARASPRARHNAPRDLPHPLAAARRRESPGKPDLTASTVAPTRPFLRHLSRGVYTVWRLPSRLGRRSSAKAPARRPDVGAPRMKHPSWLARAAHAYDSWSSKSFIGGADHRRLDLKAI